MRGTGRPVAHMNWIGKYPLEIRISARGVVKQEMTAPPSEHGLSERNRVLALPGVSLKLRVMKLKLDWESNITKFPRMGVGRKRMALVRALLKPGASEIILNTFPWRSSRSLFEFSRLRGTTDAACEAMTTIQTTGVAAATSYSA